LTAARLVERPTDAVLYHRGPDIVSAAAYLHHCHALAETLPAQGHMINLCRDRYAFAVAFGAAVLRRHPCLLTGERSDSVLATLADTFAGSYLTTEEPISDRQLPVCPVVTGTPRHDGAPANPEIPADQLAAIVFTSGSTGAPAPHHKRWGALADRSRAAGIQFALDATAPAAVVGTVPPQHMYGFETTVLLPLHAAASSWCGPAFFPGDVQVALNAVAEPRILVTTPLQMRGMLRAETSLPPLHAVISATAPLDTELAAAAEAQWRTQVLEIFGATEVGSIASRRTIEGDRWRLYPHVRMASHDDATVVTGPFAPATALADDVELLGDDQFRLLGRRTDIVKLGGHRASLSGLNQILIGLRGVTDGVFLVPDDLEQRATARLVAVVVAPDRAAESILGELRDRLDPLFLPRRVIRVAELPRNPLGKLPREALLRLVAQDGLPDSSEH
jgi:acyl-coenzyme A synthetase/AMP-(fatty) acid ligase